MLKQMVSEELLKMLGKTVSRGYVLTHQISAAHEIFSSVIGIETLPYVRRLAIEFTAKRNASSVKGLEAEEQPNRSGNYHHIELVFNSKLIITISHLASINGVRQEIPRPAHFRAMLAAGNPAQIQLFPNFPEKTFAADQVFAVLLHEGRNFPSSVSLALLDRECKRIVQALPINVSTFATDSDVNRIEPLSPEFIQLVKKASGQ